MEVLLFRHGPAGDKDAWTRPDSERPLTSDGARKTERAADGLASIVSSLDLIASSPLVRAAQTADILARRFPKARRAQWDELKPGSDPTALRERLAGRRRIALVGHEPHLSEAAAYLLGGEPRMDLKKAGAALLDLEERKLLWLLKPSQLRGLR